MRLLIFLLFPLVFAIVEDDRDVSDDNYLFDELDDVFYYSQMIDDSRENFQRSVKKMGFAHCLSSKRKSPIDIDLNTVNLVSLPPLKFDHYDVSEHVLERIQAQNFFTSMAGFTNWTKQPVLSGGPLEGNYHLMEINWNANMNNVIPGGCLVEPFYGHSINNAQHSAELHFLHTKNGLPVHEAQKYSDGIAIVVVFVDLGRNYRSLGNNSYDPEKRAKFGIHETPGTEFQWVSPDHFLPKDRDAFFVYEGSFSQPPCNSDVTWIILVEPLSWNVLEHNFPNSQKSLNSIFKSLHAQFMRKKTNPSVLYNNPKMTQKIQVEPQTSTSGGAIFTTIIFTLIVVGLLCFAALKFMKKEVINWIDSYGNSNMGFGQFQ